MRSTRVVAVVAVALLVALVAGAVALASSDASTTAVVPSHLVVGPAPPRTATMLLTYEDSNGIAVRADAALDLAAGTARLTGTASLSVVSVSLEARLVDGTVYLDVPSLDSLVGAPWVSSRALRGPSHLEDLARSMRHPDLARLHARSRSVVRVTTPQGLAATVTTLRFGRVRVPFAASLPLPVPPFGTLVVRVTTGPQGQLLDVRCTLAGPGDTLRIGVEVTGYDVPVSIAAPAPDEVHALTAARARQLFGTDAPTLERYLRDLHRLVG